MRCSGGAATLRIITLFRSAVAEPQMRYHVALLQVSHKKVSLNHRVPNFFGFTVARQKKEFHRPQPPKIN